MDKKLMTKIKKEGDSENLQLILRAVLEIRDYLKPVQVKDISHFETTFNEAISAVHTRSKVRFNPEEFIGKGWKVEEPRCPISSFDVSKLKLINPLKKNETWINDEDRRKRLLKEKLLGVDAFQFLWDNKELIPEGFKKGYITFDADTLVDLSGRRYVLYLYWVGGQWDWFFSWLAYGFSRLGVSASLVS